MASRKRGVDLLDRGGENLFPFEIEQYLIRHPKVGDVQVIGVPDTFFGEELLAVVIPKAGEQLIDYVVSERFGLEAITRVSP